MTNLVRVEIGRRSAWLYGEGRHVVPALKLTRCPRQFDDIRRAWMVPVDHVSDLMAAIEHRTGGELDVSQVDR